MVRSGSGGYMPLARIQSLGEAGKHSLFAYSGREMGIAAVTNE